MGGLEREQLLRRAVTMNRGGLPGTTGSAEARRSGARSRRRGLSICWEWAPGFCGTSWTRKRSCSVAQIIEHEADRFLDRPAPARLHGDTQAESNAWTGGGIAVAACMLKSHPHRKRWAEKANEYMISAYATPKDVKSDEVVDGKPLSEWLTAPTHLKITPWRITGWSIPITFRRFPRWFARRSRSAWRGEAVPRAVTFNADKVLDLLVFLYLPDGTELYPQNTDYTPRRLDDYLQAANILPHAPGPVRKACLLRTLSSLEAMVAECPDEPMNGWIGFPYDLGSTWGLTQNYLMFRLFGDGGEALAGERLEATLAGVFASEDGQFAVHRTPSTLSSFSWRRTGKPPLVMGLTMPLDQDVLPYPMPWSYVRPGPGGRREACARSPFAPIGRP